MTSRASERRWTVCGDPTVSQDYMFTQCDALLNNCSYEFSLNIQVSQPPSKSTSLNTYGSHNDRVRNPSPDITLTAFSGPVSKALARTNHSTRIRVCLPRAVASGLQNAIDNMQWTVHGVHRSDHCQYDHVRADAARTCGVGTIPPLALHSGSSGTDN